MIISVPQLEEEPYPTLGPQVCAWIEQNLCFGPGDLEHQPARLDDEKRALIYRFYELQPRGTKDDNGKPIEGRRRFRRCAISLQKGSAKSELAAWIAAVELSPDGPVRCDGFDANGRPVGRPVSSPYIPLVAFSEDQAEDTAFAMLYDILDHSRVRDKFDIGLERITRAGSSSSKCLPLAGAPDSRDGALTTFQHLDETHRWNSNRLRSARTTMLANLTKRLIAEPWSLETTTAYVPGENSVAEQTAKYAQAVTEGKVKDSRLFFFHRQASDGYNWDDPSDRRKALVEAAGPNAVWKDIEGISDNWQDPEADKEYLERVYGNRPIATAAQAFSVTAWKANERKDIAIAAKEKITIGFDGSLKDDATAMIATHLKTGFQWPLGIWEKPDTRVEWEVPKVEVTSVVDQAFETYDVVLLYGDPSKWDSELADWAGRHGANKIVAWPTTLYRKMALALKAYANGINAGDVLNNGDQAFARHIGNAQKNVMNFKDDDGSPLWLIQKDRPFSPNKIDASMAGALCWRAALDAIAKGALQEEPPAWSGIYIPDDEDA